MNILNVKQLEQIIDNLELIVNGHMVDMCETEIYPLELKQECGTPGCHAAWLGLAIGSTTESFSDVANEFANLIGFNDRSQLCNWANNNRHLWGNDNGDFMFMSQSAFGQESYIFPAKILVDHWRGVIRRIKNA